MKYMLIMRSTDEAVEAPRTWISTRSSLRWASTTSL